MDNNILYKIIFVIFAYLFGAFPTAYVIYKIKKGGDIRDFGSGNVGGTNITRTIGVSSGIITILVDIIKGFIPIMILYFLFPQDILLLAITSVVVILGHDFPVYIKFKGGKGIATSAGVITAICVLPFFDAAVWKEILPILIIAFVEFSLIGIVRIVSIASLAAAVATPLSFLFTGYPLEIVISMTIIGILVFITHRDNIKRLIRKEEKKIRGRGG